MLPNYVLALVPVHSGDNTPTSKESLHRTLLEWDNLEPGNKDNILNATSLLVNGVRDTIQRTIWANLKGTTLTLSYLADGERKTVELRFALGSSQDLTLDLAVTLGKADNPIVVSRLAGLIHDLHKEINF